MKILCNDCTHKDLCKFQESFKETVDSLNIKIPTPFELSLSCPYYSVNLTQCYQELNGLTITPNYIGTDRTADYRTDCTYGVTTAFSNTVDEGKPDLPTIPAIGI